MYRNAAKKIQRVIRRYLKRRNAAASKIQKFYVNRLFQKGFYANIQIGERESSQDNYYIQPKDYSLLTNIGRRLFDRSLNKSIIKDTHQFTPKIDKKSERIAILKKMKEGTIKLSFHEKVMQWYAKKQTRINNQRKQKAIQQHQEIEQFQEQFQHSGTMTPTQFELFYERQRNHKIGIEKKQIERQQVKKRKSIEGITFKPELFRNHFSSKNRRVEDLFIWNERKKEKLQHSRQEQEMKDLEISTSFQNKTSVFLNAKKAIGKNRQASIELYLQNSPQWPEF